MPRLALKHEALAVDESCLSHCTSSNRDLWFGINCFVKHCFILVLPKSAIA